MVTAPQQSISLEEFLTLPETKPAQEYINGTIQQKPMPKGKHSLLQTLYSLLNAWDWLSLNYGVLWQEIVN